MAWLGGVLALSAAFSGCASGGGGGGGGGRDASAPLDAGGGGGADASHVDGGGGGGEDAATIDADGGGMLPGVDAGQDAGPACAGLACDDGDFCTLDGCADGMCTHVANTCDDGDACTADACMSAGFCRNDRMVVTGDTCSAAIDVSAGGTFMGSSTCGASDFSGMCGAGDAPDVFLRLVLGAASNVTIDTGGSSYDTVLSMGTSCAATEIACDDDGAGGGASRLVRTALGAGTYYVALDGKAGGVGGSWRAAVTITPVAMPATVTFPTAADPTSPTHGYLWTLGSYVQGSRATSLASARSLDMTLVPIENGLTCDTQDMRLTVNGVEVGRFVVTPGSVAPIVRTFSFAAISGPTYTLRYENVREVAGGCGSARFGSSSPASTITLRP